MIIRIDVVEKEGGGKVSLPEFRDSYPELREFNPIVCSPLNYQDMH